MLWTRFALITSLLCIGAVLIATPGQSFVESDASNVDMALPCGPRGC